MDVAELLDPPTTAVVTMELQRGVVGDLAALPHLGEAAESVGLLPRAGAVCRAARGAGATVVHCTAAMRPDRQGSVRNARILEAAERMNGDRLDTGQPGTELVAELEEAPTDLRVARSHGLTPFVATELDQILRNCGVRTVVAVGVSLNIGVLGLVLAAVDLGYRVVVPRDAVVGVPVAYGNEVLEHSIAMLATLTDSDAIVDAWR